MKTNHLLGQSLKKLLCTMVLLTIVVDITPIYSFAATINSDVTADNATEDMEYSTIHIKNDKDMIEFLNSCVSDTYSHNLIIELDTDVSLSVNDFRPAEVFSGIFHGNGHKIKNLYLTGEGYIDGLFRYITESGIVENVNVEGHIEAENDKNITGGICGVNAGIINRCSFKGIVNGKSETGGIVGENEAIGIISSCSVFGNITGYNMAGGIAGSNYGNIVSCVNHAGVNADNSWVVENDSQGYDWIVDTVEEHKLISGTDIGGIAGISRGNILSCENKGVVGYDHNGYNIGGIAGRQSGQIVDCTNSGPVYGRKDVGGIVGQMEPYISIEDAESISEAAQTLHDMVDVFLDDAGDTSDDLTADLDNLRRFSDSARDSAEAITNSVTSFVDTNVSATQNLANRLDYISNQMPYILDDASAATSVLKDSSAELKTIVNVLNVYGEMENTTYDATSYKRVTTVSTVGGKTSVDRINPDAGEKVTVTLTPETGYSVALTNGLIVRTADGTIVSLVEESTTTLEDANGIKKYSFTMPAENVVIEGCYGYTKDPKDIVYVMSNVGGNASVSALQTEPDGATPTTATKAYSYVTVTPETGYIINTVSATDISVADAAPITLSNAGNNTYIVDALNAYTSVPSHSIQVFVEFEKTTDAEVVNSSRKNMADDVNELSAKTEKLQNDLNQSADKDTLIEDIADVMSTNSRVLSELSTAAGVMSPYTKEALEEASVELGVVMGKLENAFSYLSSALNKTKAAFTYVNSQGKLGFSRLDPSVSGNITNLYGDLDNVSVATGNLTGNLGNNADILESDLHSINDQTNKIFQLFAEMISDAEDLYNDESLYEDVSDELIEETTLGKVDSCTNKAKITGDIDVGGIAGTMAIDEEDPEGNAAGDVTYNLGSRYLTKCIVTGCINRESVNAKKDGVGGIVGYMNLGIVSDSQAFGYISSSEGNYVGGIAGQSLALVRDCDAKVLLEGTENVGGICGAGSKISKCKSITQVEGKAVKTGAIAGVIETEENERFNYEADIQNNMFVSDSLGGIDGMSLEGIAEQILYNDMICLEEIPTEFRHISINYYADDELVERQEVPYGTKGNTVNMPEVPNRNDGTFGVWPDISDRVMEVDLNLSATYENNIKTLSSDTDDSDIVINNEVMPYVYVDGVYTNTANIQVDRQLEEDCVTYSIKVVGSNLFENDISKVRIHNPFELVKSVEVKDEKGDWQKTEFKEYGSYLQVEMTGTHMDVRINKAAKTQWISFAIMVGVIAAGVVVLLVLGKKHIKKKKTKKNKKPSKRKSSKKKATKKETVKKD